jgi:hypothetical protein
MGPWARAREATKITLAAIAPSVIIVRRLIAKPPLHFGDHQVGLIGCGIASLFSEKRANIRNRNRTT